VVKPQRASVMWGWADKKRAWQAHDHLEEKSATDRRGTTAGRGHLKVLGAIAPLKGEKEEKATGSKRGWARGTKERRGKQQRSDYTELRPN